MQQKTIVKKIQKLIKKYIAQRPAEKFQPGTSHIPLQVSTFDEREIISSLESMLSTYVTMGKKTKEFERLWSEYIGSTHSVMVNSGSSANLIALDALRDPLFTNPITPGDEIILPAVTWSTSLFPIVQIGATPVIVDIDPATLTMDINAMQNAVTEKTRAIMPVHLVGSPCDMPQIMQFVKGKNIYVIEDCCEAHGAQINNQKVGSFGDCGTFSFMFAHHITTVEGGAVTTTNKRLNELLCMKRAHGWVRELDAQQQQTWYDAYPNIDGRFLFATTGYNVRMPDVISAFGKTQLEKLPSFIKIRRENHFYWLERLAQFEDKIILLREQPNTRLSPFAFTIILRSEKSSRTDIMRYLESRGIETRPIAGSNLIRQPFAKHMHMKVPNSLPGADAVHERGFWFGNHQAITEAMREYIANTLIEYFERHDK